MASYVYSVATDTANGSVNATHLHNEIVYSGIGTNLTTITVVLDVLTINFSIALTTDQHNLLTIVVNCHTGIAPTPGDLPGILEVTGTGSAGISAPGVVTIQGITSGVAVPITGSISATNPSVSAIAAAPPWYGTYVAGSVTTGAPTYTTGQLNALSLTTAGRLRIDGSGTTQPVSGTVTATNPSVNTVDVATPGSATFIGGAVATSAPTYVNGNMSALSLTTGGLLRTDGSGVTQPVSASSLPLPTGASTEATLALIKAKTDNLDVALSTRTSLRILKMLRVRWLPLRAERGQFNLVTLPIQRLGWLLLLKVVILQSLVQVAL
jgi:hypothetical protein